jgi:hypothetical protein
MVLGTKHGLYFTLAEAVSTLYSLSHRKSVIKYTTTMKNCSYYYYDFRLGGVVVSVLVTGPKGCGFEPGQDNGFLRAIKIRSSPSFRDEK